ncbi:MAG TPA: S53 family peptidase, partial [Candidatus Baltobacteraceae bacterium]|nr:S53 family peptidase [Candidatus Baltobacteraceae bacterium]
MITPRARTGVILCLAFVSAAAITACGGGGGSTPPIATPASANPAASAVVSATPRAGATPTPIPTNNVQASATLAPIPYGPGENGWGPYAVANAFQFPVQSGFNGSGMTIAVINDYPPAASDVSAFLAEFQIQHPGTYRVENVNGGSAQSDQSGLLESTLDVETIEALAPGANVIYYATPDLSTQSLLDAYEQVISDGQAQVVDMSYGGCEASVEQSADDSLFSQGAAQGIAFVAASGDWGDECFSPSGNEFGVNYPASDPNVIGVGGTQSGSPVCTTGNIANPAAFNDRCKAGSAQEATGGGVSSLFPKPAYQNGLGASTVKRNVPDVAMPAAIAAVDVSGSWTQMDGTSWGTPQIAAMLSELYQYCKGPIASPVQIYYSAYNAQHYSDFVAVTSGNNQFGSDTTYFAANGGFSNVSGIGMPLGTPVAKAVCPNRTPVLARAMRTTAAL